MRSSNFDKQGKTIIPYALSNFDKQGKTEIGL